MRRPLKVAKDTILPLAVFLLIYATALAIVISPESFGAGREAVAVAAR